MAEVDGLVAHQGIDVVAADPPHELGKAALDLFGFSPAQVQETQWVRASGTLPAVPSSRLPKRWLSPFAMKASMATTLSRMVP